MSAGNPYHDDKGKFTHGSGGAGEVRRASDARPKDPATTEKAPLSSRIRNMRTRTEPSKDRQPEKGRSFYG